MPTSEELPAGERKFEMSEREVEQLLKTARHGVLSLAVDDEAYAVPMSFGYDGEGLYFLFRRPATESRKLEFIRKTDQAVFVVSTMTTKHDWASVVVEGPVVPVDTDGWSDLLDAFGEDVWFPSIFSETDPREDFIGYYLAAERATGRRGADYVFEG